MALRIASPRWMEVFTTRSSKFLRSANAPCGIEPLGQSTVVSICGLSLLPNSISMTATTTLLEAMAPFCATHTTANAVTANPNTMETINIPTALVFFMALPFFRYKRPN